MSESGRTGSDPPLAPGVPFRERIGTPGTREAARVLLLGSGEIGREIAIEAIRLGAEVIAVDRYAGAPAMAVAHRAHVLPMTDAGAIATVVEREAPDVIVPEIEQIATEELVRLEHDGWTVIPNAEATRTTMDRERIRRLAADVARVPTSAFRFADSLEEARAAARDIGFPCLFKALVSSSGHGMTWVRSGEEVTRAYAEASEHGRVPRPRIMIEEFVRFDREVTLLTLRHYDPTGAIVTTVMDPIVHARPGTLYHESWQPDESIDGSAREALRATATAVTDRLGGIGIFGVECFVAGSRVYFSEVSPRPHDTGLVTLGSQWNSEFALHARAILGLPYVGPEPVTPAACRVILGRAAGWGPILGGLREALTPPGVRLFLFGKPQSYPDRRLGVVVARAPTVEQARQTCRQAAEAVESQIKLAYPADRP
ncbi:MAG: formate-dependent phosphoribosylglycinamide formyltransferase [Thermoplasmata archaeon]